MNSAQINNRLEYAVAIAREAGELTLTYFRSRGLNVERKGDGSPVTIADKGAEELLRKRIAEQFPADAIIGEEFGETPGTTGFKWILDPIDGTKSFVSGVPLYTTLVAVMQDDEPLLGVIFAPAVNEMLYAALGQGCWHIIERGNPQEARVSNVSRLADAVFVTTCPRSYTIDRKKDGRQAFESLTAACRVSRTWGDAFGYLLVATGRAEIMVDPILNLWDAAALLPIIQEAGGRFFDWRGVATVYSGDAVATNAILAKEVQDILALNLAEEIVDLG